MQRRRILIAGGPRCGKTTLARELGGEVRHTDDLIGVKDWSEASAEVAGWLDAPFDVIEGVAVPRAIRKWLVRHANDRVKPCERFIWLDRPHVALAPDQLRMAKGCRTVLDEIRRELGFRGVKIETP